MTNEKSRPQGLHRGTGADVICNGITYERCHQDWDVEVIRYEINSERHYRGCGTKVIRNVTIFGRCHRGKDIVNRRTRLNRGVPTIVLNNGHGGPPC